MKTYPLALATAAVLAVASSGVSAPPIYSNPTPDGRIAMTSRPSGPGGIEIETADDFLLTAHTLVTSGTFTGLVPAGSTVTAVNLEIYRVFPSDSTTPPSGNVPTRTNSPSDLAFDSRSGAGLTFTTTLLNTSFTTFNSVLNGINPKPTQTTGGEGSVTGQEVEFAFTLPTPFDLPADHYFFVPQVQLDRGNFYWLSAPKPIPPTGTPFTPDLQAWIRNGALDPDWLRVGTDVIGPQPTVAPTYNAAFSLNGAAVPEAGSTLPLLALAALGLAFLRRRFAVT